MLVGEEERALKKTPKLPDLNGPVRMNYLRKIFLTAWITVIASVQSLSEKCTCTDQSKVAGVQCSWQFQNLAVVF